MDFISFSFFSIRHFIVFISSLIYSTAFSFISLPSIFKKTLIFFLILRDPNPNRTLWWFQFRNTFLKMGGKGAKNKKVKQSKKYTGRTEKKSNENVMHYQSKDEILVIGDGGTSTLNKIQYSKWKE